MSNAMLADCIDRLLPQTQCTQCGYPTCRAYATAIAAGRAGIDRCAPGGAAGIAALAELLERTALPLDSQYGVEAPPLVAVIDEQNCIGCTKCIQACPVDAIVGAAKRMHTVIASQCTGCGLCLPPCPVDCIDLPASADTPLLRDQVLARAVEARARFDTRNARLTRMEAHSALSTTAKKPASTIRVALNRAATLISRDAVLEAIARGKARRERYRREPRR